MLILTPPRNKLHKLLLSLILPTLGENKFDCPLQCFLAAFNLRQDGQFQKAHLVTSPLAGLKYALRSIILTELLNMPKGEDLTTYDTTFAYKIEDV